MNRVAIACASLALVGGCDKLQGLGGTVPPIATITVEATVDPGVPNEHMQIAMVWGEQFLPEALCIEPLIVSGSADAVIEAGCRDPFGFVPYRVETSVPATFGVPTTIELEAVPGADVLVGDVTARVGYASFVLYDDVNQNGTLDLARANTFNGEGKSGSGSAGSGSDASIFTPDVVYGASFVSMAAPDIRLAYREGAFVEDAFYPRHGCSGPPPAFSILGASGFTGSDAIAATLMGQLPPETDPSQCSEAALGSAVIEVAPTGPDKNLAELACIEQVTDSSVRYREPDPLQPEPDFTGRQLACTTIPMLGSSTGSPQTELIVTDRAMDSCAGLTHYILTGCTDDPSCATPEWDHTGAPPTWWPCH
jgi:hypothetical protein